MRPTENIENLIKNLNDQTRPDLDAKILEDCFAELRQNCHSEHSEESIQTAREAVPYIEKAAEISKSPAPAKGQNIWSIIMHSKITKPIAAAIIVIGVLAGIYHLTGSFDGASVAWADVVEKFRSMSFYNAVLYFKEDAASEPKQIELWVSSEHKARVRVDSQVLFADKGKVVAGYNFKNRKAITEEEYDPMGEMIIQKLCENQQLSLENVVKTVCKGQLQEITPNINSDAMISQDLLVFDLESTISPEWMRIWALRESKLPVRLRMWDPRDGECMDVFVTYEKQQPAEFFDYQKYEQILNGTSRVGGSVTNKAYALLKDPGGKNYAPEDLFKESGYHMPQVEQVGITEYGAVWIVASKAMNRKPNGIAFYGFSSVVDDLGRKYTQTVSSHWTREDVSPQIFVPEDYPFDKRVPKKITLICDVETYSRYEPKERVGTVDITEWKQNTIWPDKWFSQTEYDVMLSKAAGYIGKERYDQYNRVKELIQQSPDSKKYDYRFQQFELSILMQKKQFAEADALAEQLWPIELEYYKNLKKGYPNPTYLLKYIVAIAANGQVDRAAELFKELKETKLDLSEITNKNARRKMLEHQRVRLEDIGPTVHELFNTANLTLEQVSQIVGFDISKSEDPLVKSFSEQAERDRKYNKMKADADAYLEKLSEYYNTHSLPERIELLERQGNQKVYLIHTKKLPGHEGYEVLPINYSLKSVASNLKHVYKYYPSDIVSCQINEDISEEFLNREILVDVIHRDKVSKREAFEFVLEHYGLEVVVENSESRKVWVVRYDGKPLENYEYVHIPYPNLTGTIEGAKPGTAGTMSSFGMTVGSHLEQLQFSQNKDVKDEADKKIFIDETGIQQPISMETAIWPGEEGFELARQWFEKNFGITVTEEVRPMPVLVVRNKQ